jgi:hypothetical protein
MSKRSKYQIFLSWLKTTLPTFVGLTAIILLLLVCLKIFQVPSFVIGNDRFWLLRWQYEQNKTNSIAFNPLTLFFIASAIGIVGVYLKPYFQQKTRKTR